MSPGGGERGAVIDDLLVGPRWQRRLGEDRKPGPDLVVGTGPGMAGEVLCPGGWPNTRRPRAVHQDQGAQIIRVRPDRPPCRCREALRRQQPRSDPAGPDSCQHKCYSLDGRHPAPLRRHCPSQGPCGQRPSEPVGRGRHSARSLVGGLVRDAHPVGLTFRRIQSPLSRPILPRKSPKSLASRKFR